MVFLPLIIPVFKNLNPIAYGQGNAQYDVVNLYVDNNNWTVPFSELLSNDGNPNNQFVSVNNNCNIAYNFIGTLIIPSLDQINQKFILTNPLTPGIYHFCPDVLSGGVVLPQLVVVIVSQKNLMNLKDCCPDNCNLVCGGDFENYPMTEEEYGYPSLKIFNHTGTSKFKFQNLNGAASNLVMVSSDGANRRLFFPDIFSYEGGENPNDALYDWNQESGFVMPLREGIQPGKTVTITFQATMFGNIHENSTILGKKGYVRLFGMNADFPNAASSAASYPRTKNVTPFNFNTGNIGHYISSNLDEPDYGIPVPGETVTDYIPYSISGGMVNLTAVNGLNNFNQYSLQWTNNTNQVINYIMIIGDGYTEIDSKFLNSRNDAKPTYRVVAVDNFSVTKAPLAPLCITGTSSTRCSGDFTQTLSYNVCWCDKGTGPVTITAHLNANYNGLNVQLPSGSFDANGNATFTLTGGNDCETLSFNVIGDVTDVAGTYNIPLTFQTSGGCTSCGNGFYIKTSSPATLTLTDCAFTCGCPDPNNVGAKNTNTYWSSLTNTQKNKSCMAVEGNLVMDQNVSLFKKQFIMQDNSTITIFNNQISYDNCTLNGCEYLWNGIRLNNDNAEICFTSSIMKDAIEGIKREKRKAFIASYRSQFINNRIGISLPLYLVPPYNVDPNTPIIVEGNSFTSPSMLDHPILKTKNQKGFAGITGSTSNEVFGNVDANKGNTFRDIGNGIYIDDCYAAVNNSTFSNIQPLSYYYLNNSSRSGFGINNTTLGLTLIVGGVANSNLPPSQNSFDNVNVGIYATANLFANNTKMENVNTGISFTAHYSSGLYSSANHISANRFGYDISTREESPFGVIDNNNIYTNPSSTYTLMYGMRVNLSGYNNLDGFDMTVLNNTFSGTDNMRFGIHITNAGHWNINGNNITSLNPGFFGLLVYKGESIKILNNGIYGGVNSPYSRGIALRSFNDSYLQCNLTQGTGVGIDINSPNVGSEFVTNEMKSNSSKGLYMNKTATYTSAFNGGVHYLAGNLWTGSQNSVPAIHYGVASQITSSRFRTNNSSLPTFPIGYSAPGEQSLDPWFASGTLGNDKVGDCNIPAVGGNTDWLIPYATNAITYSQFDTSLQSTGKHMAFEYMKKNPGLTYSSTLSNFYTTYGASNPGKIDDIRIQVRQAIIMPQAIRTAIINYRNQIITAMGSISLLQSALSSRECSGDIPTYKAQSQVLTQQIIDWQAQIKSLTNTYKTNRNNTLANLLQQLALIPDPNDAPSYFEKVEVHKEIDYFLSGSDQLNTGAMTDLINIASLCPDYGGAAVYRARAFIAVEQPGLMWDDNNCDTIVNPFGDQIEQRAAVDAKVSDYTCYPNPSTGQFTIKAPESYDGYIKVVDSYGSPILHRKYSEYMSIDLRLNNGLYYVLFLSQDNDVKYTQKMIIIK